MLKIKLDNSNYLFHAGTKEKDKKIFAIGGRVLNNSNPKYINSPESVFFKKRNLLYNLDSAKKSARQKKNLLLFKTASYFNNNI